MTIDNKIKAKIDEVDKFIYFFPESIQNLFFDQQIHNFCSKVAKLSNYIKNKQNKLK